ncbi:MAG: 50S ribosomal protein L9 [Candidatus Margulisiibacteriota bacterium]
MKVVLLKDTVNIGDENEVVDVSEGYARNYLIPKKIAIVATDAAIKYLEKNKKKIEKKIEDKKVLLKEAAKKIGALSLEIKVDVGEGGKMFGSVTNADIAHAIKEAAGIELDKRKIHLDQHIKAPGNYPVTIKLFSDIEAKIQVAVIP